MKYKELLNKVEQLKSDADKYLDELADYLYNGIKEFGYADLIPNEKGMIIWGGKFEWRYEVSVPQKVFMLIYNRLMKDFFVTQIKTNTYRVTLKYYDYEKEDEKQTRHHRPTETYA